MGAAILLIQIARRNKEIKGGLKGELGLVGQRLPAIPARRAERAGGVRQAIEKEGERFVGGGGQGCIVHRVCIGIVDTTSAVDTIAETVNALQVGFHVSAPLGLRPRITVLLEADRGVHRKGCGAIRFRRVDVIPEGVTGDAGIVYLVKIVKLGSSKRLLFDGQGHFPV